MRLQQRRKILHAIRYSPLVFKKLYWRERHYPGGWSSEVSAKNYSNYLKGKTGARFLGQARLTGDRTIWLDAGCHLNLKGGFPIDELVNTLVHEACHIGLQTRGKVERLTRSALRHDDINRAAQRRLLREILKNSRIP